VSRGVPKVDEKFVVYLLQGRDKLKIGRTKNLRQRVRNLSNACGEKLVILYTWEFTSREDAKVTEKQALNLFKAHRLLGEWFKDREEIRTYFSKGPTQPSGANRNPEELSTTEIWAAIQAFRPQRRR
jgi:hypothetical protein